MKKYILIAALLALAGCKGGSLAGANVSGLIDAGTEFTKAATLSDADVATLASQVRAQYDTQNRIAPAGNAYAKRLARIVKGLDNEDGMKLNFKVYLTNEVNAFAMADGTVRVYSGLLDKMTDDEARFVIGHEIGHVKLGHSKKAMQVAYASLGLRKAAASSGNVAASTLSKSQLGDLGQSLLKAQFSQSQETAADEYGLQFMQRHKYNINAAPAALRVLAKLYGNDNSVFSSHPGSADRAANLEKRIASGKY